MVTASIGLHAVAAGTAALLPEMAWWALGGVAVNQLCLTAAGLWPRSRWLGPNHSRLPAAATARRAVALTLDDGPDPAVTPRVLDLLDEHGVRATFFCIARRAREHPALLREIVARGHSVQNHSHRHRHNFALLGPRALTLEIGQAQAGAQRSRRRAAALLSRACRAAQPLPRPGAAPSGPAAGELDAPRLRHRRARSAARAARRLTDRLGAGDILLLHDGHATSRRAAASRWCWRCCPRCSQRCRDAGLHAETLREAIGPRSGGARMP